MCLGERIGADDETLRTCPPAGMKDMVREFQVERKKEKVRIKEGKMLINWKISLVFCSFCSI